MLDVEYVAVAGNGDRFPNQTVSLALCRPGSLEQRLLYETDQQIRRQTRDQTSDPSLHIHWPVSLVTENPFSKPKYGTEIIFLTSSKRSRKSTNIKKL